MTGCLLAPPLVGGMEIRLLQAPGTASRHPCEGHSRDMGEPPYPPWDAMDTP